MVKQLIVKRRSLLARIRRTLARQGRVLITDRNSGDLAVIDQARQALVKTVPDLEEYGRSMGALRPFERLER
jgi:hypothetical protein